MILFVLLTAFSRNYLGVHTPQDVLVGLLVSALGLFLAAKLFQYLEKNPEKEDWFLLGGFLFCCAAIAYITFKPYPMTYDAEGKLLVDPQKMMNDGYGDIGKAMGFIIARFVEKNWIKFQPLKKNWLSAVLCVIFLIPMVYLKDLFRPVLTSWLGNHWGKLVFSLVYAFYYIALIPLVLKLIGSFGAKKEAE